MLRNNMRPITTEHRLSSFKSSYAQMMRNADLLMRSLRTETGDFLAERPKIKTIIETVCAHYNQPISLMLSRVRTGEISKVRQIAMFLCRTLTDYGFEVIGNAFQRDHGTVISACASIESRLETRPVFQDELAAVEAACVVALKSNVIPMHISA